MSAGGEGDSASRDPEGDALGRLVEELERLREAGQPAPEAAGLAVRFGLSMEDVAGVLAGRAAMADLVEMEEAAGEATELSLPVLPDDYELLGELGRGGMGVVYRARQVSLDREVAVKVMRPAEILFAESMKRFGRETRALAKLRHPHIAAIHDVGESDGNLFFTMDLIGGGTLAEHMARRRRPSPLAFAVRVMRQVGSAVAFVHGHGLVHRDLKPANILLDKENNAHVVDFGLALDPAAHATLTATGRLMGTPAYMAPEQALGERALVTERTDIYGLGVLLYELVCGAPPFRGGSIIETVRAVVQDEPAPPRRLRKDLPRALENVILKAIAKDPAKRYGTAEAMVRDLERFAGGEAVEARPPGVWDRTVLHVRRRRVFYAGVFGAAVAAVALFLHGGFGSGLGESPEARLAIIQDLERNGDSRAASALAAATWRGIADEPELSGALDELTFRALSARLRPLEQGQVSDREEALRALEVEVGRYRDRGGDPIRAALLDCGLLEHRTPEASMKRHLDSLGALEYAYEQERQEVRAECYRTGTDPVSAQKALLEDRFLSLIRSGDHPLRRPAAAAVWKAGYHRDRPDVTREDLVTRSVLALIGPDLIFGGWALFGDWGRIHNRLRALNGASRPAADSRSAIDVSRLVDCVLDSELGLPGRNVANGYLCALLELPSSSAKGGQPFSSSGDGLVRADGSNLEFTPALNEALARRLALLAREGRDLPRGEWLIRAADTLVQNLEAREAGVLDKGVDREHRAWFYERFGLTMPAIREPIGPWWQVHRERGALGLLVDACAVEGVAEGNVAEPESRKALVEALLAESGAKRVRWIHELLAMTQPEGVPVPRFLWVDGGGNEMEVPPRLRDQWRDAVGAAGPDKDRVLELAMLRWPGGIGRPEILWNDSAALDGGPTTITSESLEVGDALWTGQWGHSHFGSHEFFHGRALETPVSYRDIQPGCVRLWVDAKDTYSGGRQKVSIRNALVSRVRGTYAVRRVYQYKPRHEALLGSGDVRVVADWTWNYKRVGEDRFALLARVVPGDEAGLSSTRLGQVEGWAAALMDGMARGIKAGAVGPTESGVDEVDLSVAARLAFDLSDNDGVRDASVALAEHLSLEKSGSVRRHDLQFIGSAVAFRALVLPESVSEEDLIIRIPSGVTDTVLQVQERIILSESAEVRRLARASIRNSRTRFTEGEIQAMHRVAERHGDSDRIVSQWLRAEFRRPLSLSAAGARRLWLAATILVLVFALLLPAELRRWTRRVLYFIGEMFLVAMLALGMGSVGIFQFAVAVAAIRHARIAREERQWPAVGSCLLLFFAGFLAIDYFGEPAIGHCVACASLTAAFVFHGLIGLRLARRGERQLGSKVAWGAAALTLPHALAWAAILSGSDPLAARWVTWLDRIAPAQLLVLVALFTMLMSPTFRRIKYPVAKPVPVPQPA